MGSGGRQTWCFCGLEDIIICQSVSSANFVYPRISYGAQDAHDGAQDSVVAHKTSRNAHKTRRTILTVYGLGRSCNLFFNLFSVKRQYDEDKKLQIVVQDAEVVLSEGYSFEADIDADPSPWERAYKMGHVEESRMEGEQFDNVELPPAVTSHDLMMREVLEAKERAAEEVVWMRTVAAPVVKPEVILFPLFSFFTTTIKIFSLTLINFLHFVASSSSS